MVASLLALFTLKVPKTRDFGRFGMAKRLRKTRRKGRECQGPPFASFAKEAADHMASNPQDEGQEQISKAA
jgi:hypothetical protein